MKCERCGTVFCWDEADSIFLGDTPRRYCGQACKKAAKKTRAGKARALGIRAQHRRQVRLRMCRERPKPGHATEEAAMLAAARLRRIPPLYPYECPCGSWHLTSLPPGETPGAEADHA